MTDSLKWTEKEIELGALRAFDKNPRQINKEQFARLIKSLKENGYNSRMLVDADNVVIGGHMRLNALKELGFKEDDTIKVLVPSRKLTAKEFERINIQDNVGFGEWDVEALANSFEMSDLIEWGVDENVFAGIVFDEEIEEVEGEDEAPEVCGEGAISKLGDLWILGKHRLLCGDATNISDVEKLMNGNKADMVFTDPPYNVNYDSAIRDKIYAKDGAKTGRKIINDNLGNGFAAFLTDVCANMLRVTSGALYICMSCRELDTLQSAFRSSGGKWSTFIIWAKNTFVLGGADYHSQYEPILYGWKDGNEHFWCGARNQSDVWFFNKNQKNDLHPTMKPVELVCQAVKNSSKRKDIVLDFFGGSGSTLIACEKTERQCYMMELDPKYIDVIIKRWQQFTGDKAVLSETGQTFDEIVGSEV